jgi:hypothetical protein
VGVRLVVEALIPHPKASDAQTIISGSQWNESVAGTVLAARRNGGAQGETMRIALILVSFAFVACGGSSSGSGGPSEAPITMTASGLSTAAITIPSGGRVHFFNMDSVSHQITSQNCPALDTPTLMPGMDSLGPLLTGPLSCNFGDALTTSAAFNGSITVNPPGAPGGGAGY